MLVKTPSHPFFSIDTLRKCQVPHSWWEDASNGFGVPQLRSEKDLEIEFYTFAAQTGYTFPAVYVKKRRNTPIKSEYYDLYFIYRLMPFMDSESLNQFLDFHLAKYLDTRQQARLSSFLNHLDLLIDRADNQSQNDAWPRYYPPDFWELDAEFAANAVQNISSVRLWIKLKLQEQIGEAAPTEKVNSKTLIPQPGKSKQLLALRCLRDSGLITPEKLGLQLDSFIDLMALLTGCESKTVRASLSGSQASGDLEGRESLKLDVREMLYQKEGSESSAYKALIK